MADHKHNNAIRADSESFCESVHGARILPTAPTFDSETGVQVSCQEKNVCSESSENSIYLMQNLRIGNSNCLTFFDSGENTHLVDEQLAEKEKLQLKSSNSTALGVIGGGAVMTEYGNFRFNLGPGEDKIYYEITAVEMRNVTASFGKQKLEEIGQEFKSTANSTEKNYILPKTVGETKVHLLLGVKNTRIQPVLIRVLPSGLGVYLSTFKDVGG